MKIITIAGTVGKDGRFGRTQSGDPVLGFSVAVDDGYGQNKSTMWFDCSIWGKRADALQNYITKGSKVTIVGDLGRREHEGKTYLTVRVSEIKLQGGKQENQPSQDTSKPDIDDDLPF